MVRKIPTVKYLAAAFIFIVTAASPYLACAQAETETEKAVVFLLDASGSMESNDASRYAIDGIAQLAYALPSNYEVGFAAYNADVCASCPLSDNFHRNEIVEAAENVQYAGYSNAGAGMEQAVGMLLSASAVEKDIVLLSDGECLMGDEAATLQAYTSYQQAVTRAAENGIRIHVIGLGGEMDDSENSIFQAASATGGGAYYSPQALEIQASIDSMLQEQLCVKQVTAAIVDAGAEMTSVEMDMPFSYASTVRVLLTSSSSIYNLTANFNADNARQINGERYSLIEIGSPKGDKISVSFSGTPGHQTRITLIPEYRVQPKASVSYEDSIPENESAQAYDREAVITYTFYDMDNDDIQLWTEHYFEHSRLSAETGGEIREGTLENGQLQIREDVAEMTERETSFICDKFPANILGMGTVKVLLEAPPLLPMEEPEEYPWMAYGIVILAALFLGIAVAVRIRRNKRPTIVPDDDGRPEPGKSGYVGKLNIYITRTASGYDISPLSYDLFRLPFTRVISLAEILSACGVSETFEGAGRIYISSGQGRSIILTNQSDCCIMKSREILMKNKSYQLFAGAKVDVAFEDEISELTFQYRDLKPSEMR